MGKQDKLIINEKGDSKVGVVGNSYILEVGNITDNLNSKTREEFKNKLLNLYSEFGLLDDGIDSSRYDFECEYCNCNMKKQKHHKSCLDF